MKYSIIVPCYKCEPFFDRLMDSIVSQEYDDMEVILVRDDDSDLESLSAKYNDKLNIRIIDTDKSFHTPGNTRNYGLDSAVGEWVLFIDCDDELRSNCIKAFNEAMEKSIHPCYFAKMKQYHPDGREFTDEEDYQARHVVWLHGKCYHVGFLREHNIRFKPDMKTCEDYYFNYQVLANMHSVGYDYGIIDEFVYNWLWNGESLSRSDQYVISLKDHFYDHIYASLMSWVNVSPESDRQFAYAQYLDFLSVAYFLYQYYRRRGILYDTKIVADSIAGCWSVFGITMLDLINAFEDDYPGYVRRYNMAKGMLNEDFVCQQGFREWILSIYK